MGFEDTAQQLIKRKRAGQSTTGFRTTSFEETANQLIKQKRTPTTAVQPSTDQVVVPSRQVQKPAIDTSTVKHLPSGVAYAADKLLLSGLFDQIKNIPADDPFLQEKLPDALKIYGKELIKEAIPTVGKFAAEVVKAPARLGLTIGDLINKYATKPIAEKITGREIEYKPTAMEIPVLGEATSVQETSRRLKESGETSLVANLLGFTQLAFDTLISVGMARGLPTRRGTGKAIEPLRGAPEPELANARAILRVKPNATFEEIQVARRSMLERIHPDKVMARGGTDADVVMANRATQTINQAYEMLVKGARKTGEPIPQERPVPKPEPKPEARQVTEKAGPTTSSERGFIVQDKEGIKLVQLEQELARLKQVRHNVIDRTRTTFKAADVTEIKKVNQEIEKVQKQLEKAKEKTTESPKDESIPIELRAKHLQRAIVPTEVTPKPEFTMDMKIELRQLEESKEALKPDEMERLEDLRDVKTEVAKAPSNVEKEIVRGNFERELASRGVPTSNIQASFRGQPVEPITPETVDWLKTWKITDEQGHLPKNPSKNIVKELEPYKYTENKPLYRGIALTEQQIIELLNKGELKHNQLSSWTPISEIASRAAEDEAGMMNLYPVLLKLNSKLDNSLIDFNKLPYTRELDFENQGRNVEELSREKEVIMKSGTYEIEIVEDSLMKEIYNDLKDTNPQLVDKIRIQPRLKAQELAVRGQPDELVTLYHGTSPEMAAKIKAEGKIRSSDTAGGTFEPTIYLTESPETAKNYGTEIIKVQVPRSKIESMIDRAAPDEIDMQTAKQMRGWVYQGEEISLSSAKPIEVSAPKAYKEELGKLRDEGKDVDYFVQLELEEFNKAITKKGKFEKTDVIREFIEEEFPVPLEDSSGVVGGRLEIPVDTPKAFETGLQLRIPISLVSDGIHWMDKIWFNILGKHVHKAAGKAFDTLTPEVIKRNLVYGYGRPENWLKLNRWMKADRTINTRIASRIVKKLEKFTPDELRQLKPILESGIYDTAAPGARPVVAQLTGKVSKGGIDPVIEELMKIGKEIDQWFFGMGEDLVRLNILTPEQFAKYAHHYFPYVYDVFEGQQGVLRGLGKRLDLSYAKKRKDLDPELQKQLGLIDDSPKPIAKRMVQELTDLAMARMYRAAAQDPAITSEFQSNTHTEQLPKTYKLGDMSEKWVPKEIATDIEGLTWVNESADALYQGFWGLYKTGKVTANPSTVARNIRTNTFLADVGGNLPPEDIQTWALAMQDVYRYFKKKEDVTDIDYLVAQGVVGTEFFEEEIHLALDRWQAKNIKEMELNPDGTWEIKSKNIIPSMINMATSFLDKTGKFYNTLEVWAKVAIFKKNLSLGETPENAAKIAEQAVFNYGEVPPLVRQLRTGGSAPGPLPKAIAAIFAQPFFTFRYKAYPMLLKSFVKKPFTWMKWVMIFNLITSYAANQIDIDKKELQKIMLSIRHQTGKIVIPTGKTRQVKTSGGSTEEQIDFLDFTYDFPLQDALEFLSGMYTKDFSMILRALNIGGNPFVNILTGLLTQKDPFFGTEIYDDLDTPSEVIGKMTAHTYNQLTPTFLSRFGIGRLMRSILKKPTFRGETESVWSAVQSTIFGLKRIPYQESIQQGRIYSNIKKLEDVLYKNLFRIGYDQSITNEKRQKLMDKEIDAFRTKSEILLDPLKK